MCESMFHGFALGFGFAIAIFIGWDVYDGKIEFKDGKVIEHPCAPANPP